VNAQKYSHAKITKPLTISTAYSYNNFSAVVADVDGFCTIFGTLICLQSSKTLWKVSLSCCTTTNYINTIKIVLKRKKLFAIKNKLKL